MHNIGVGDGEKHLPKSHNFADMLAVSSTFMLCSSSTKWRERRRGGKKKQIKRSSPHHLQIAMYDLVAMKIVQATGNLSRNSEKTGAIQLFFAPVQKIIQTAAFAVLHHQPLPSFSRMVRFTQSTPHDIRNEPVAVPSTPETEPHSCGGDWPSPPPHSQIDAHLLAHLFFSPPPPFPATWRGTPLRIRPSRSPQVPPECRLLRSGVDS